MDQSTQDVYNMHQRHIQKKENTKKEFPPLARTQPINKINKWQMTCYFLVFKIVYINENNGKTSSSSATRVAIHLTHDLIHVALNLLTGYAHEDLIILAMIYHTIHGQLSILSFWNYKSTERQLTGLNKF